MLSYEEALARILDTVPGPLSTEEVPLADAVGRAIAKDIFADSDLPPFDNSAVDGYALNTSGQEGKRRRGFIFPVVTESRAGHAPTRALEIGEGASIYTGAPLPEGTDAIVMVEDVGEEDFGMKAISGSASPKYIRHRGSNVAQDTLILSTGQVVGTGEVGLLAAFNQTVVPCVRLPYVGILSTGDELIPVGDTPLGPAQIRDSNGPALAAAVFEASGEVLGRRYAQDTKEALHAALDDLTGCDVLIASGGVSVGTYDVVRTVLEERGELDFWRIAIKPGKPLAFGKIGGALFFGLPGNPVSSLVTFELFVRPVLRKLAGFREVTRRQVTATLTHHLPHESGRREFVRATLSWKDHTYHATPTGSQASHRLASMLGAECLLMAHEDHGDYSPGTRLPALLLTG